MARQTFLLVAAFFFFGGFGGLAAAEAPATDLDLDSLLSAFARMPGLEARFEEHKYLALLSVPLRSEGRLFFSPKRRLLRRVESPRQQDILVSPNQVRIIEGDRVEIIDLAARSEIRPLVESLLWIFSGDRAALERAFIPDFHIDAQGDHGIASRWTLQLIPKNPSLSALLHSLSISGAGWAAEQIEVSEKEGDRSVMRIFEANPERRFTSQEESLLFGLPLHTAAAPDTE